jgi:hypothetical protein
MQWGTSCLNILRRVFGDQSDFYRKFDGLYGDFHDLGPVMKAQGILKAAKDDYERDLLFDTRTLVEAEVFDDFLEQARHLFDFGYYPASVVIAGSVLEDGLRKICQRNKIEIAEKAKLDQMNAELAKHGVYNNLQQKRITVLADIRNKAAHGKWEDFDRKDAEEMVDQVRAFMEVHYSHYPLESDT